MQWCCLGPHSTDGAYALSCPPPGCLNLAPLLSHPTSCLCTHTVSVSEWAASTTNAARRDGRKGDDVQIQQTHTVQWVLQNRPQKFHTQILIAISFFSFSAARHGTPSNPLTANYLLWKPVWWSCPAFKIAVVWLEPQRYDDPHAAFMTLFCLAQRSTFKIKHLSCL